jgi:hypothetical protein
VERIAPQVRLEATRKRKHLHSTDATESIRRFGAVAYVVLGEHFRLPEGWEMTAAFLVGGSFLVGIG